MVSSTPWHEYTPSHVVVVSVAVLVVDVAVLVYRSHTPHIAGQSVFVASSRSSEVHASGNLFPKAGQ